MIIIDGDGHVAEPMTVWTDYLDAEFYPRFHHSSGPTGIETLVVEDHISSHVVHDSPHLASSGQGRRRWFSLGDAMNPRGILPANAQNRSYGEAHPGGSSSAARLKVHDEEGLAAAVLFTTLGLYVGSVQDPQVAVAVARALNNWLGDFCSSARHELFGVATLPIQDPGAAAQELRRCVDLHGFVAGTFRPNPAMDGTTLADQELDPVWHEAQDLDVPICLHSGSNGWQPFVGRDRLKSRVVHHITDHSFEHMIAFGGLFETGLFDRFPRLWMGFMESSAGWAPWWIDRLEEHVETWGWTLPPGIKRSPAEVFHDQCIIGGEGGEPMIPYVQERLGNNKVLWASDFPHFDCQVPGLISPVLDRPDLSPDQRDAFIGGAAARFYKLDVKGITKAHQERLGISEQSVT
jgi:predicted TIM-barrel fold metal-dependent hydrolase